MTMTRRTALGLSGATVAGLSFALRDGVSAQTPAQTTPAEPWPDTLIERPLRHQIRPIRQLEHKRAIVGEQTPNRRRKVERVVRMVEHVVRNDELRRPRQGTKPSCASGAGWTEIASSDAASREIGVSQRSSDQVRRVGERSTRC